MLSYVVSSYQLASIDWAVINHMSNIRMRIIAPFIICNIVDGKNRYLFAYFYKYISFQLLQEKYSESGDIILHWMLD